MSNTPRFVSLLTGRPAVAAGGLMVQLGMEVYSMGQAAIPLCREPERPPVQPEDSAISDLEGRDELVLLRDRLEAAVRAVCPYWMRDHQQDIVQVAMIAVLKQQQKQGARQFPASYLRRAAYTAMIDEIRRRRSRGEVPLEAIDADLDLVEERANPERRCSASEIASGVRKCLQRLASPRRAAVTLHLLGYKVPRIAEKMGWKRKQAENLVYRGMDNLRECLSQRGLEP